MPSVSRTGSIAMPSHLSSIGFRVDTRESFAELLSQIVPVARRVPTTDGSYLHWAGSSGEELWLQVDNRGQGLGVNPHFVGRSSIRVAVTEKIHRNGQTALDGAFHCWANPSGDGCDYGDYPFVFDCPDSQTYPSLTLPHRGIAQVAAFASEVTYFPSQEAFDRANSGSEVRLGSKSVIPAGLFTISGGPTVPPTADVILSGHILQVQAMRNEFSRDEYLWALVETFGGAYDVVIDPRLIEGALAPGGVISGTFWLSGRLSIARERWWKRGARLFGAG